MSYRVIYRVSPFALRITTNRCGKIPHILSVISGYIQGVDVFFKNHNKSLCKNAHVLNVISGVAFDLRNIRNR